MSLSGLDCLRECNYSHVRGKTEMREYEIQRERNRNWGDLMGEGGPKTSDRDFFLSFTVCSFFFIPGFFLFNHI